MTNEYEVDWLDPKSVRTWMRTQPFETSSQIACRAAIRSASLLSLRDGIEPNQLVLLLRAILAASCFAARGSSLKRPKNEQNNAFKSARKVVSEIEDHVSRREQSASNTVFTDVVGSVTSDITVSAKTDMFITNFIWRARHLAAKAAMNCSEIRVNANANTCQIVADALNAHAPNSAVAAGLIARLTAEFSHDGDAKSDLFQFPVWRGNDDPAAIKQLHSDLVEDMKNDPSMRFWLRFYEGIYLGRFSDWELANEVLLITDEDWDLGYKHIGEVIARIEVRLRTAVSPPIVRSSDWELFRIDTESPLNEEVLDFVRQRVGSALDTAIEANKSNGFNETCYEAIALRKALESTNPSAVAGLLYDASLSFQTSIGDLYPEDGSLVALRASAYAGSEEICETDELARARCLRLAKLARNPNAEDVSGELEEFAEEIAKEGDETVAAILREDASLLAKMRNAPKYIRARFTNYSATIVDWIDKAKKGDARVAWLVKTLRKILDWWQSGPPIE